MSSLSSIGVYTLVGVLEAFTFAEQDEPIVKGSALTLYAPTDPLAHGSVALSSNATKQFTEWSEREDLEAYNTMQRVVALWADKGIHNYLIIGKAESGEGSQFHWEAVPYSGGWAFLNQLSVLWNLTFGPRAASQEEQSETAEGMEHLGTQSKKIAEVEAQTNKLDAFCDPVVIQKQSVFEGKTVRVLYNYAPLIADGEKLHFMVIPKAHRPTYADLTEEEYVEAMALTRKLVTYYRDKGYPTAYLYDKSGEAAGQTVPHWHEHVVLTASKVDELRGKWTVFRNMILGTTRIPDSELKQKVASLHIELQPVLGE